MLRIARKALRRLGIEVHRIPREQPTLYRVYPTESLIGRRFYNIGAGNFYHPYWTNVDYATEHYREEQTAPFLSFDLMSLRSLPIADNSAELVYTSHTVEHISDAAAQNLFDNAHRILKRGGFFRLATPDFDLEYSAFRRGDRELFFWTEWYSAPGTWEQLYTMPLDQAPIEQLFLEHFATQLTELSKAPSHRKYSSEEIAAAFGNGSGERVVADFCRQCQWSAEFPGSHINWWNYAKAERMLRQAGFKNIYRSAYGQSSAPPMRNTALFDNTHPKISLYVEAER
jgi:SAM-dependent methyltransferase